MNVTNSSDVNEESVWFYCRYARLLYVYVQKLRVFYSCTVHVPYLTRLFWYTIEAHSRADGFYTYDSNVQCEHLKCPGAERTCRAFVLIGTATHLGAQCVRWITAVLFECQFSVKSIRHMARSVYNSWFETDTSATISGVNIGLEASAHNMKICWPAVSTRMTSL